MAEINEKDPEKVSGGITESDLIADVNILLSKAGIALTRVQSAFASDGDVQSKKACINACSAIMDVLHHVEAGSPWDFIGSEIEKIADSLESVPGSNPEYAKTKLRECCAMIGSI